MQQLPLVTRTNHGVFARRVDSSAQTRRFYKSCKLWTAICIPELVYFFIHNIRDLRSTPCVKDRDVISQLHTFWAMEEKVRGKCNIYKNKIYIVVILHCWSSFLRRFWTVSILPHPQTDITSYRNMGSLKICSGFVNVLWVLDIFFHREIVWHVSHFDIHVISATLTHYRRLTIVRSFIKRIFFLN